MAADIVADTVPPSRMHHQVAVRLCEMIRAGRLRPGERLPSERDLAEQLQVGRSSVREALRVLEASGVVASRRGSGAYLRDAPGQDVISPLAVLLDASGDSVGDLWEVRIMFEPPLAARAALRATALEVAALERLVVAQEPLFAAPDKLEESLTADREFHVAIAQAARNQVAVQVVQLLKQVLHESRRHFGASSERRWQAYESHCAITRAIREREPQAAYDCMLRHLQDVEAHIVEQLLEQQPSATDAAIRSLVTAQAIDA